MTPEPIPFLSFSPQHDAIRQEALEAMARVYDKNWFILGDALKDLKKPMRHFAALPGAWAWATAMTPWWWP